MSRINKFAGEGQEKFHHVVVSEEKSCAISEEKVVQTEKVTPREEVEKGTNILNYIEDIVHKIRRKDLDNLQGQYIASTGWFNLDHEWFKTNLHLN